MPQRLQRWRAPVSRRRNLTRPTLGEEHDSDVLYTRTDGQGGTGLVDAWPLFGLAIRTGRLELRLPTEVELVDLMALARAGIHAPDSMPFGYAWTDSPARNSNATTCNTTGARDRPGRPTSGSWTCVCGSTAGLPAHRECTARSSLCSGVSGRARGWVVVSRG